MNTNHHHDCCDGEGSQFAEKQQLKNITHSLSKIGVEVNLQQNSSKYGSQISGTCPAVESVERTVCSICFIRSLKRPRSVQLECKHMLCNVCYSKVFCCPFCRCPLYGSIGRRLKRANKMFLCLMKQFKNNSCCKASSVLLLQQLLAKTEEQAKLLDGEKEGVKKVKSRIHTLSGTVYFKLLGELDKAALEYKKALDLNPVNLEAMNLYAGVLSRTSFTDGEKSIQQAISLMRKAISHDPDNPILLCNLSKYYAQLGDYEASMKLLDTAGKLQNKNKAVQRYICANKHFLVSSIKAQQHHDSTCITKVSQCCNDEMKASSISLCRS